MIFIFQSTQTLQIELDNCQDTIDLFPPGVYVFGTERGILLKCQGIYDILLLSKTTVSEYNKEGQNKATIMTALIYIVCFFVASVIQVLLRSLLASGAVPLIPGSVVIYLVALWVARKWSTSYKEHKEMKRIQEELTTEPKSSVSQEDSWICKCDSENVNSLGYCPICKRTHEKVENAKG